VVSTTSFSLPGLAIAQDGTTVEGPGSAPAAGQSLRVDLEEWDGTSRVNILLMGLDYRDWEAGDGPPRTDSMMLFTYDPATGTAGILSIPRDLWIEVPGFGHQKINAAYQLGEGAHLPGGGPGLAVKTVEQFLGITINYYGQIDFSAFERFVDLIGGVKIDVQQRVKVQIIGEDGERVIKPGVQVLNGAYALAYARARHTDDGDFDRARRQQEILLAIRQQLLREEVRYLIVTHAFEIYQDLSSGINTNMTLDEMLKLGFTLRNVEPSEITQSVIAPPNYVTIDTSPDGLSILKPITENIRVLRDELFNTTSVRSVVAINSDAQNLMRQEAANVVVNNGSGVSGLAESTTGYLQGLGFTIASTGNSDVVNGTTLIDYTSNPYTLQYLVELMGVTPSHIFNRYDPTSQIDVEVIVGPEWVIPAQ
jgi:LCP family protein required for cell wall assembly